MFWNDPLNPNGPNTGIVQNNDTQGFSSGVSSVESAANDIAKIIRQQTRQIMRGLRNRRRNKWISSVKHSKLLWIIMLLRLLKIVIGRR